MYHAQVCIIMENLSSVVSSALPHPHPRRRRILQVRWGGKYLKIFTYSGHKTQSSFAAFPWFFSKVPGHW